MGTREHRKNHARRVRARPGIVAVMLGSVALVLAACGGGGSPASSGSAPASTKTPVTKPGTNPPAGAKSVASSLTSTNTSVAHGALAPAAAGLVSAGPLFPAGSVLTLQSDSWHQSGRFANAIASVTDKSKTSTYEIGFLETPQGWRVTFATPSS
jgi:hypothetical protein